jgi:DNA-binding transcriptional regulator YiaG
MATRVDVRAIRDRLGENRESFRKRFPVSNRTVRRWENGEVDPSPMAIKQLDALRDEVPVEPPGPRRRVAT